jgi:hypothetical protein
MIDTHAMQPRLKSRVIGDLALLSLLFASIGAAAQSTAQALEQSERTRQAQFDINQPYVPIQTDNRPCRKSDWSLLALQSTRALLADYGYEATVPITCQTASVPWLPSARILRVHESIGLDNYREFSIVQGSRGSRIWLIPIEFGMVGYPHTEDNPHNIAAFNDLLQASSRKPDENLFLELGNLYQFMVGSEEWFNPDRMPKTIGQALQVNDIQVMIERDPEGVKLKHREFDGDRWTHTYLIWEFYFKKSKEGLRLASVERGPLDPDTDDIKAH